MLRSEVEYAVKQEFAVSTKDVLERRIGLDFINREKALSLESEVQKIIDTVNNK